MARRGLGTVFIAAVVSAWGACTPFGDAPTDDGPADVPGPDAGFSPTDAAPSPIDRDATADGPVSSRRFCERDPQPNCADFDGPHMGGWSDPDSLQTPSLINGATLFVDPNAGREGGGLRVTLPAGGEEGKAHQELRIPSVDEFSLSADVLVEKPSAPYMNGSVTVLGIVYGTADGTPAIEAKISPSSPQSAKLAMYVRTGPGSGDSKFEPNGSNLEIPFDTWVRITVYGALLGTMGNIDARVTTDRGGEIVQTSLKRSAPTGSQTTRALIGMQRYQATTDAPLTVRYDNVIGGPL